VHLNGQIGYIMKTATRQGRHRVQIQSSGMIFWILASNLLVNTGNAMQLHSYDRQAMPSQHRGFVRRDGEQEWLSMDILVDSGSQQPPLIASRWAKQWGLQLAGTSAARQVGGALLPI
jgi:hypothetical protein